MDTVRRAACACGQLTATCTGEPVRNSVCHCLSCKRRTGSAFAWNATFADAQVAVAGESRSQLRHNPEGRWSRTSFCPDCGSTIFYRIERRPGMVTIPVGAFAEVNFPEPTVTVYGERRHAWLRLETKGELAEE